MVNIVDNRFLPAAGRSPLGRLFTIIECPHTQLRYLILDCPTESTLDFYLEEFKRYNVTDVVRCCQPTYQAQRLNDKGIQVLDLPFKDGGVPPPQVIQEWLELVENTRKNQLGKEGGEQTIAVHCVAGLGRAPLLVAIALIEMGMKPLDAIEYIRSRRRGAFNKPQIMYLDSYKRILKPKSSGSGYSIRSSLGRMFKLGSNSSNSSLPKPATADEH